MIDFIWWSSKAAKYVFWNLKLAELIFLQLELAYQVEHSPRMSCLNVNSFKHFGQKKVSCLFVVSFKDRIRDEINKIASDRIRISYKV